MYSGVGFPRSSRFSWSKVHRRSVCKRFGNEARSARISRRYTALNDVRLTIADLSVRVGAFLPLMRKVYSWPMTVDMTAMVEMEVQRVRLF